MKDPFQPTPRLQTLCADLDRLSMLATAAGKDYNDELTFIINHVHIALDRLGPSHPASRELAEVHHAAMRCAETSRCLLLLAGRARAATRFAHLRPRYTRLERPEIL